MDGEIKSIEGEIDTLGAQAKKASANIALASSEQKNKALEAIKHALSQRKSDVLKANQLDVKRATEANLKKSLIDRLLVDDERFDGMLASIDTIIQLEDPVGRVLARFSRPNGLNIERVSVPLGVIAVIYESRPNVTIDASTLCLKSGNCAILRGGSDSFHTAQIMTECIQQGLMAAGLDNNCIQMLASKERSMVDKLVARADLIDVVVPRGGEALIRHLQQVSKVPLFMHLSGLCHSYVHYKADLDKALSVCINAKMRRTGICGATETLLIDEAVAEQFTPLIVSELKAKGCEVRGDEKAQALCPDLIPAKTEDWDTEYLDAIIAIKIVKDIEQAIAHINHYGSHHTDAIITEDKQAAHEFLTRVNSAIVMHNASTQFADGGEFGMGAEIGIATGKLHARGPVGLEQLTTFNYRVYGDGQVRP